MPNRTAMKTALLLLSLFPIANQAENKESPHQVLNPGEASRGVVYEKNGSVTFQGKALGQLDVPAGSKVLIAEPSPLKGYTFIVPWDGDQGGIKGLVIDGSKRIAVADIVQKYKPEGYQYPVENRVGPEIKWSPDEAYAVTPDIGEVQDHINIVDLRSGRSTHFHVGNLEQGECEIQGVNLTDARWSGTREIIFEITVSENPWSDIECPKNAKYPLYQATVNVETKEIKLQKK